MIRDILDSTFMYYFDQGKSHEAYKLFGAHLNKDKNGTILGVEFCLFAPNAKYVSVVGEWNFFNKDQDPMQKIDDSGVWYLYLEGDFFEWKRYKFFMVTKYGEEKG